ncbi:MAG: N-acetylglucosamine-6-phosphate deacetylase [Psychrilyobacter sp.]|uniref:N-acetylglucosamine-6-phosphate deacetylase n=1 Tax=Psychrilyobacter sp. TaxID=2586924 RepID=UPI003C78DAB4
MIIKSKHIYTENGVIEGFLEVEQGKIKAIFTSQPKEEYIDYTNNYVIPGFIDIHTHGWGRGAFGHMGDVKSIQLMAEDLVKVGVTSFLPTTLVMPQEFLEDAAKAIKIGIETQIQGAGSEILGVHFEGPFLNKKYLGMQKLEGIKLPSVSLIDHYNKLSGNNLKLMTLAPELEGSIEVIKHLKKLGITSSAGHTSATFDEIKKAKEAGLNHFTHTYSAMRGLHHRELGVVGAAMYFQDMYAEVGKQTGITIKPEAFDILYRLKTDDKMIMVTDCIGFGGLPEGYEFYHYLRKAKFQTKNKELIVTHDSGKIDKMDKTHYIQVKDLEMSFIKSVRAIVSRLDKGLQSISKIASENPAKLIGVFDKKGSIKIGKDADFLILDNELNLLSTYCYGNEIILQEKV